MQLTSNPWSLYAAYVILCLIARHTSIKSLQSISLCSVMFPYASTLQSRHNKRVCVSNHQPHDCLLKRLFKAQIKDNIKAPRHWHECGNLSVTGEFPAQSACNKENVSIWWRHHDLEPYQYRDRHFSECRKWTWNLHVQLIWLLPGFLHHTLKCVLLH